MNRLSFSPQWLLIASLLLFLAAWGFKGYEASRLNRIGNEARTTRQHLQETVALQKLWEAKGLGKKLSGIQSMIPQSERKKFLQKRRSLEIQTVGMGGRELNRLLGKLGALPLQFQRLTITRDKDRYSMECRCKW